MAFCTVSDVHDKNALLAERDESFIQDRIDEATRTIIQTLRPYFADKITATYWLSNPPASIPNVIKDICITMTVGQCLFDAYGDDNRISDFGLMMLGKADRALDMLKRDPKIIAIDGTVTEGTAHKLQKDDIYTDDLDMSPEDVDDMK